MDRTPQSPRTFTLRDDAATVLDTCPAGQVRTAARRIGQFMDRRLAPAGFSHAQFSLMCLIAAAADDTLGALADRADLDQSTLSRNLDALARAGLVEITTVEADRRRRAVWLTETGARRLQAAMPLWRAAQDDLTRLLDPGPIRDLADRARALAPSNKLTGKGGRSTAGR